MGCGDNVGDEVMAKEGDVCGGDNAELQWR